MDKLFYPKPQYQWRRHKVTIELKYLHIAFQIFSNYTSVNPAWYTIRLHSAPDFYLVYDIYISTEEYRNYDHYLLDQITSISKSENIPEKLLLEAFELETTVDSKSKNPVNGSIPMASMVDIPFLHRLSASLIKNLYIEEIEQDSIMAMAIYLHFSMIRCFESCFKIDHKESIARVYGITKTEFTQTKELLIKKFEENRKILYQIRTEVFPEITSEELGWISQLRDVFTEEVFARKYANSSLNMNQFNYGGIPDVINLTLGLDVNEIQVLYYFINKTFNTGLS